MAVKIGILSAALISHDFVISLRNLDPSSYKIVAVAATSLESAQKFAEKFKIPKAYGNYQELANDPEVELVYIANRNMYHYAAAKLMIEQGKKHVLIEKPFTIDVQTTRHLFELGKKYNVFVMEALWTRFLPAYHKVREIINSGTLGEIIHISTHFIISNTTDRLRLKKMGGGVTLDIGVYALNSIFEGVGYKRPTGVKAFGRLYAPGESDVSVSACLDFPNECTATMMLTCRAPGNGIGNGDEGILDNLQQVVYIGTKGYLKINDWINCPTSIELNGEKIDTSVKDSQTDEYNWPNSYGLSFQVAHAIECIKNKKIVSDLHGPEQITLLTETMRRVMQEVGSEVIDTPISFDFKTV